MPTRIPTALFQKQCQGTLPGGVHCQRTATWFVALMKGDEEYACCDECAAAVEPFERPADWVEYARNERR